MFFSLMPKKSNQKKSTLHLDPNFSGISLAPLLFATASKTRPALKNK
jgi:hypothetical protein